jgi:hypothetical protein
MRSKSVLRIRKREAISNVGFEFSALRSPSEPSNRAEANTEESKRKQQLTRTALNGPSAEVWREGGQERHISAANPPRQCGALLTKARQYWPIRWGSIEPENISQDRLAEGVGFEPTLRFPVNTLSKRAPSATRPPLQRMLGGRNIVVGDRVATRMLLCAPRRSEWPQAATARPPGSPPAQLTSRISPASLTS